MKLLFEFQDDRWSHRVVLQSQDRPLIQVLESVEGGPDQVWPLSPPLQDASFHELTNGDAVLAVGMAGTSHWSGSFSIEDRDSVLADLACLQKNKDQLNLAPEEKLKSTYQLGPEVTADARPDGPIDLSVGGFRFQIESATHVDVRSTLLVTDRQIQIQPIQRTIQSGTSIRWGYRINPILPEPT